MVGADINFLLVLWRRRWWCVGMGGGGHFILFFRQLSRLRSTLLGSLRTGLLQLQLLLDNYEPKWRDGRMDERRFLVCEKGIDGGQDGPTETSRDETRHMRWTYIARLHPKYIYEGNLNHPGVFDWGETTMACDGIPFFFPCRLYAVLHRGESS